MLSVIHSKTFTVFLCTWAKDAVCKGEQDRQVLCFHGMHVLMGRAGIHIDKLFPIAINVLSRK